MPTANLPVSHGQFFVRGADWVDVSGWSYTGSNGLVASLAPPGVLASPGEVAVVLTGTPFGYIRVEVETGSAPLPLADVDMWDEIAEVSLTFSGAGYVTNVEMDTDSALPDLPEGDVRLRVYARGRDQGHDTPADTEDVEPVEEYLLQAWPSFAIPECIIKQSDGTGSQVRAQSPG